MTSGSVQPTVACPMCGARPRIRIGWRTAAVVRGLPADDIVLTYQCVWRQNRHRCDHIFPIRVKHIPK